MFSLVLCATFAATPPAAATAKARPPTQVADRGKRLEQIAARREPRGRARGRAEGTEPDARGSAPSAATHRVQRGETLSELALRFRTTVQALSELNGLEKDQGIRAGQLLILRRSAKPQGGSWQPYLKPAKQKGYLNVVTPAARFAGVVVDAKGRLRAPAVRALNGLLGAGGAHPPLPERLIRLLVEISDSFGGRAIRVVSGYRTTSYYEDSRHKLSAAVDFVLVGVPNPVLCDYLRRFDDVGVGYYPNSTFVHLDVRNHSAYWVDYSGPGQPPRSSPNSPALPRREDRRMLAELDSLLEQTTKALKRAGTDTTD